MKDTDIVVACGINNDIIGAIPPTATVAATALYVLPSRGAPRPYRCCRSQLIRGQIKPACCTGTGTAGPCEHYWE
jgi:hypothetical protein